MIAVLVLAAALATGTDSTRAACVGGISFDTLAQTHPLIFEGDVTGIPGEVVLSREHFLPGTAWKGLRVAWKVVTVWQGEPGEAIEIVYTHHAAKIHGRFETSGRFIVWAYQHEGRWQTSDCSPTIERERAAPAMMVFLERLKK